MKNFRASESVFMCDDCGDELKVVDSIYNETVKGYEIDLDCRNCGPVGKDFIADDSKGLL